MLYFVLLLIASLHLVSLHLVSLYLVSLHFAVITLSLVIIFIPLQIAEIQNTEGKWLLSLLLGCKAGFICHRPSGPGELQAFRSQRLPLPPSRSPWPRCNRTTWPNGPSWCHGPRPCVAKEMPPRMSCCIGKVTWEKKVSLPKSNFRGTGGAEKDSTAKNFSVSTHIPPS